MKRLAAVAVWVCSLAWIGCQPAATDGEMGGTGPMLATAMDTIQFGRNVVVHHGCGDCHGGGDNPSTPVWLSGARDTIFGQFRIPTPDGKVYLTRPRNLTPDNETGIGRYSEQQIFNAIRFGLRPNQTPDVEITSTTPGQGNFPELPKFLAPPMPWPAFRHMTDLEIRAIAAYLKRGVKPVANMVTDSEGPPDFWAGLYTQFAGPTTVPAFPTAQEQAPPQ
jgi:mono/diheme cytochrome c family protein